MTKIEEQMSFKIYVARSKEDEMKLPKERLAPADNEIVNYPCIFIPLHSFLLRNPYAKKEMYEALDYDVVELSSITDFESEVGNGD